MALARIAWRNFGVQSSRVVLCYYFRERMGSKTVIEWSAVDHVPVDLR
jgi:hypothetical protein